MKKCWLLALMMLTAATLCSAADFQVSNKYLKFRVKNGGTVEVCAAGSEKPYAVIRPDLNGLKVTPRQVERRGRKILLLRGEGEKSSMIVTMYGNSFSISLNRTGKPVKVEWPAKAVVLPDRAAEDILITPGKTDLRLPGFVNLYLALLGDREATLACIPVKNTCDAILSADLQTLTLNQKNTEEHIFVLNKAPGVWHKVDHLVEGVQGLTVDDWKAPYPASWVALYPVDKGFLASGDGMSIYWNIVTVTIKGKKTIIANRLRSMTMTNPKTRYTWNGGFEASYTYPAEFINNKVKLTIPKHRGSRFCYDQKKPVYIYSWARLGSSKAPGTMLPGDLLPAWKQADSLWRTVNIGSSPTTCATTADFEKLFYRDEAAEKKDELVNSLWAMQCFVESIRSRVENARVWAAALEEYAARAVKNDPTLAPEAAKLNAILADVEKLYAENLPKMQNPDDALKLSARVIALADDKNLDEEEKENEAKKLGRAIRTIGGTQDNTSAYMRRVGKNARMNTILNYAKADSDAKRAFWKHVWNETAEMLQGTYGHDGK